ncbi:head maturation protease, ClpP-related [Nitrosomonas communis]|uniref:head maturation protease, ClpP-related n=1 Tax=Nitrosomonas communis TaxID=44574 RepID=UPI003D2DE703
MKHKYLNLSPGTWRINKTSDEKAEVFLYGDIGGWMDGVGAEEFNKELAALDVTSIDVRLNSGGGSVFEGQAIYNALNRHPAKINIHIDGLAASIASVIAMAGDQINITEGSHIMIHKPWSIAMGDAEAMRKEAEILDSLESGIMDIYAARTNKSRKQIEDWIAAETWFKGQEAVDAGFADALTPAKRKKNSLRSNILNFYSNTPQELIEFEAEIPKAREIESLLRDVEGFSIAQAKRIANLVCSGNHGLRDADDGLPMVQIDALSDYVKNYKPGVSYVR